MIMIKNRNRGVFQTKTLYQKYDYTLSQMHVIHASDQSQQFQSLIQLLHTLYCSYLLKSHLSKLKISPSSDVSNCIYRQINTYNIKNLLKKTQVKSIQILSGCEKLYDLYIYKFHVKTYNSKIYNILLKYEKCIDAGMALIYIEMSEISNQEVFAITSTVDEDFSYISENILYIITQTKCYNLINIEPLLLMIEQKVDLPTMDMYLWTIQQINGFLSKKKYYKIHSKSKYKTIDNAEMIGFSEKVILDSHKPKTIHRLPCDIYYKKTDTRRIIKHGNTSIITTYGIGSSCTRKNYSLEDSDDGNSNIQNYSVNNDAEKSETDINPNDNLVRLLVIDNKKIKLNCMIGYKIVNIYKPNEVKFTQCLLELKIPKDARVASAGEKHRCDKALPVRVFIPDSESGGLVEYETKECYSTIYIDAVYADILKNIKPGTNTELILDAKHRAFKYYIDTECRIDDFEPNLNLVCVPGIHFQWTPEIAAKKWGNTSWKNVKSFEIRSSFD